MANHNLLLVDDEVNILNALKRLLRKEGHTILTATSGKEGLEILGKETIALIISDQKMPEMNGVEFLNEAKKMSPESIRIMLTGYADIQATMDAINKGEIFKYITKPWDDIDIKITINQALKQYDLVMNNIRLVELTNKQNTELQELNKDLETKVEERTKEIAVKNEELKNLFSDLEKNFLEFIRVFVHIIEQFNPILGAQSKKVALFARLMAQSMGLSDEEVENTEIAAMLHDIGLIGMPHEVTDSHPEKLRGELRTIYKRHPGIGQDLIKHIKKLDSVGIIIRHHHENFDGSGYPDHLMGVNIPVSARIITICDFYVNLKNRTGSSLDFKATKEVIEENNDTIFDPKVTEHLYQVLQRIKEQSKKEVVFLVNDLREGLIVSRDIFTHKGIFLIGKNTILNKIHINTIHNHKKLGNIDESIYVIKP